MDPMMLTTVLLKVFSTMRQMPSLRQPQAQPARPTGKPAEYSIEWLQQALNDVDEAGLDVDGKYGDITRDAVKLYQERRGLKVDGWAGVQTMASLFDELNEKA